MSESVLAGEKQSFSRAVPVMVVSRWMLVSPGERLRASVPSQVRSLDRETACAPGPVMVIITVAADTVAVTRRRLTAVVVMSKTSLFR
jgi:hypothetical protein